MILRALRFALQHADNAEEERKHTEYRVSLREKRIFLSERFLEEKPAPPEGKQIGSQQADTYGPKDECKGQQPEQNHQLG